MWVGSNICFGFIVCSPQHKGCWSFRKCQEGVKVLDDFKWKKVQEGWSCPGWADFVAVGRMVLAHRYCWAQGFKEQPMEKSLRKPMRKYQEKKTHGIKCYHLLSPSDRAFRAFFGRGVQFNQPAFDQKTMKVSSWIFCRVAIFVALKTRFFERWWTDGSLKTRPSISQRQKEWYDLFMMLVDAITCRNVSCTCIHHTLLITDKCCFVTVKNCQI